MEYGCYNLRLWRFSHGWGEEGGERCLSRRKSKQQNKHVTQIYDFISFFYETISCFSFLTNFILDLRNQFNSMVKYWNVILLEKMFSICGILQHFFRNISKELSESLLTLTFFCNISKNQVTKKYHNSFVLSK